MWRISEIARRILMRSILYIAVALIAGCSGEEPQSTDIINRPVVVMVCPVAGLGDNGYNDMIMRGVMEAYGEGGFRLSVIYPRDLKDVSSAISTFLADHSDVKSLLLLADNSYASLLPYDVITADNGRKILVVDTPGEMLPDGVVSFEVCRYGAYYLAGCMARPHMKGCIILGMKGDRRLEEAARGFEDGYAGEVERFYLADDVSGFSMPGKAYEIAAGIDNAFIIPLAGGSNMGIYKYSRETDFYMPLVAGTDSDCALLSHRVPFSVVIRMDNIIKGIIGEWLSDPGFGNKKYRYGLADGSMDIVISHVFAGWCYVWEDYYSDKDYWNNSCQQYRRKALEMEKEYEDNQQ